MPNYIRITDINLPRIQTEVRATSAYALAGLNFVNYLNYLNRDEVTIRLPDDPMAYGTETVQLINRFSDKYGKLTNASIFACKQGQGLNLGKAGSIVVDEIEYTSLVSLIVPITSNTGIYAWHTYNGDYRREDINADLGVHRYVPTQEHLVNNEEYVDLNTAMVVNLEKLHSFKNIKPGVNAILTLGFLDRPKLFSDLNNNTLFG